MSNFTRRSVLIGAAGIAPLAVPLAPYARADENLASATMLNVKDFGAIGDGTADDTAAIEAGFAAAASQGVIYFPPGNFRYNGTGLKSSSVVGIIGAASVAVKISLGPDSYFIDYAERLPSLLIRDITFEGGRGVVKHRYAGNNVAGHYRIQSCSFKDYTECAIASESVDMPYWHIWDCVFDAANNTNAIGVALGGGPDQSVLDSCSFIRNRVHVKVRKGNNFRITNCDFIQSSPDNSNGPRVAVWVVPDSMSVNAGTGLTITGCKFGNENMVKGDLRIVYADEGDGASNGTRLPELQGDSSGYVLGNLVMQNSIFGISDGQNPLIYSTTPNVRGLQVCNNVIGGSQPTYIVEFKVAPTTADRFAQNSLFGPFTGQLSTEVVPVAASNAYGVGFWLDPQGIQQEANSVRNWESGASASFREILSDGIDTFGTVSVDAAVIQDAYGGRDALELVMNGRSAELSSRLGRSFIVGMPTWVEFDVAAAQSDTSSQQFYAWVGEGSTVFYWRRCVTVPEREMGWVTYAFSFVPRTTAQGVAKLAFSPTDAGDASSTLRIGRPRVYQANERQIGGRRPRVMEAATTGAETTQLVNDLRSKLIDLGILSGAPVT